MHISDSKGVSASAIYPAIVSLIAALVIVLGSRLIFLLPGYGEDADAWRVAVSARQIAEQGTYVASRLPGYPLQEGIYALIWWLGPLAMTGLTALLALVATVLFAMLLRRYHSSDSILTALAFAFTPIVFIHSTTTLDYLWSLAFVLGSWLVSTDRRPGLAGLLLGAAIGCRITAAAMVIPLAIILAGVGPRHSFRQLARFTLCTLLVAGLCWLPVFLTYGTGFLTFFDYGYPSLALIAHRASIRVWGVLGCIAIAVSSIAFVGQRLRPARHTSLPPQSSSRPLIAWLLAIGLYSLIFLRVPHEPGYLIPVVPFVLLVAGRVLQRKVFQLLCVALIAAPWFASLQRLDRFSTYDGQAGQILVQPAGQAMLLDLMRGPIWADHQRRERKVNALQTIVTRAAALPTNAVVISGEWWPLLEATVTNSADLGTRYMYLLDQQQIEQYLATGHELFYLPDVPEATQQIFGYDIHTTAAKELLGAP